MYKLHKGSTLIGHTSCLSCPSSDGRAIYEKEGGIRDSYCFVCNTYFPEGEGDKRGINMNNRNNKSQTNNEDIVLISKLPINPIDDRGINYSSAKLYGIRTGYDIKSGEPKYLYFPIRREGIIVGYKRRGYKDKVFTSVGDCKSPVDLFGQTKGKGKMVVITEGEIDAASAWQMFNERGKNYRVWSLPQGANIKSIESNLEILESFETIILALDQDEVGRKCAKDIARLLSPGKVRIMSFSEKDANDMLLAGKSKEWFYSLNSSEEVKPDGIVTVGDIIEEASKPIERGLSWPWPSLSKVSYGIRRKELYGFGGGTGAGKTEGFKEVIQHIIFEHKRPVGLFFLEETPPMTLKSLAGKMDNKTYHIPDSGWSVEELRRSIKNLEDKVYLYNHFGQKNWSNIRGKIRYMVISLGIKDIFLDHLTALVADEENVNKALEHIMADMSAMTQELDFTLYFISHLTTPLGRSHEEGGRVTASQFRGSRTIAYWTHFLFGYERNQQAEDIDERNSVILRVLKDRYTGMATGVTIPLRYDRNTGRFLEIKQEF